MQKIFKLLYLNKKLMEKISHKKIFIYNLMRIVSYSAIVFLSAFIITTSFGNQKNADNQRMLNLRVVGTAFIQGKVATLLEDSENGIEGFFEEGQEVAGYTIVEISNDGVLLNSSDKDYFIKIFSTERIPLIQNSKLSNPLMADDDSLKVVEEKTEIASSFEYKINTPKKVTAKNSIKTSYSSASNFILPVNGYLSSGYGWRQHPMGGGNMEFHKGWDIVAKKGTPVRAASDGIVTMARYYGDLGYAVFLNHKSSYHTRYGHLSKILVKNGQEVKKGDIIGLIGSTGMSTGSHLHFEIHQGKKVMNPKTYLSVPTKR